MSRLASTVVLLVAVYSVAGRPAETPAADKDESLDVRQGWNQQQPIASSGLPVPGYPVGQPLSSGFNNQQPYPGNSRPAYAYDNAFPDQVNFAPADTHHAITSAIQASIPNSGYLGNPIPSFQNVGAFIPTGYQAPSGIVASASAAKL